MKTAVFMYTSSVLIDRTTKYLVTLELANLF